MIRSAANEESEAPQPGQIANGKFEKQIARRAIKWILAVTIGNEECRVNALLDVNLVVMSDDTRGTIGDDVVEKEMIAGDGTIETDETEDGGK